jgi:hypothetical protein
VKIRERFAYLIKLDRARIIARPGVREYKKLREHDVMFYGKIVSSLTLIDNEPTEPTYLP